MNAYRHQCKFMKCLLKMKDICRNYLRAMTQKTASRLFLRVCWLRGAEVVDNQTIIYNRPLKFQGADMHNRLIING